MKIQFIVVGWHYNQSEFYESLSEMEQTNENVDVFWTCHKEPPQEIKDSFDWKLFDNLGEEFIAYQQAVDYLDLDDETFCFFIHDDCIIKNWEFVNICVGKILNGDFKWMGNCFNYPMPELNPQENLGNGITEEFDNATYIDYVKDENKHFFDRVISPVMIIRGSFICTQYKYLKEIGEFEPRKEAWVAPHWSDEHQTYCYRNEKGLGSFGNVFMFLLSYKVNRHFGPQQIGYLSDRYLDSDYIYEMGRGEIDPNNPMR